MKHNEEHGSTLDQLLERLPILDGGGRRRLIAGSIVLLSATLVFTDLPGDFKAIAEKGSSLSALLAVGGLLVYAAGMTIEVVGEVFLARAVSNATWSFVSASNYLKLRYSGGARFLLWPLVVALWGSVDAVGYFIAGLFGNSKWRMSLVSRLSPQGEQVYAQLPDSVRKSIDKPLGYNSEFGRKALVNRLNSADDRRWARRQLDRPKDVLALVSAIVIALTLYLSVTRIDTRVSEESFDVIKSYRAKAEGTRKELQGLTDAAWVKELGRDDAVVKSGLIDAESMVSVLNTVVDEADVTRIKTGDDIPILSIISPYLTCPNVRDMDESTSGTAPPESLPAPQRLANAVTGKCEYVYDLAFMIHKSLEETRRRTVSHESGQILARILIVVGAMFLYVAFFNTLMSSTIIVIEAIGEQMGPVDDSVIPIGGVAPAYESAQKAEEIQ